MATLQQHLVLAKKLNRKKISDILFGIISDFRDNLVETNKKQLLDSKDSENKNLFSKKNKRGTYSILTEKISKGRKKAGAPYTLEDKGDFFKGFYVKTDNEKILFSSKDDKTQLLISEYGDIFGLTDKNLKIIIQKKILPFFIKKTREELHI